MGTLTLNITQCPIHQICDTNISGATITSTSYSKISSGNLELSSGVLGDYVIEWRLNAEDGEILFVSGNQGNTDTSISRFHPFLPPDYEIVPGGTIYPVIRYVEVDGVRYDGYYSEGANYSPDLRLCLTSTQVDTMECDNGAIGSIYSHTLSYSYENPNGSSSRSTIFQYPNDGSEAYFAFKFTAYDVVDMIKVFAVKEGPTDTITHLIGTSVGYDNNPSGLITSGNLYVEGEENYSIRNYTYSYIVNLTGVECDYLRIEITSSAVDTTNTATDWVLNMKCLSTWDCDKYIINTGWTTLDLANVDVTWDSNNCTYIMSSPSLEARNIDVDYNNYFTFPLPSRLESYTSNNKTYEGYLEVRLEGFRNYVNYNTICYTLNGTVTYNRDETLQRLRISFTNSNDFEHYKTSYETTMANPNISNYSTDNTNINFYKYIYIREEFRDINCIQDNSITRYLHFHPSSYVKFNNVPGNYYMDIFTHTDLTDPTDEHLPHYPLTIGINDDDCYELYDEAVNAVFNMNRVYNTDTFTDSTKFTNITPISGLYLTSGFTSGTTLNSYYYQDVSKVAVDEVCPNFNESIYSSNTIEGNNYYVGEAYRYYHHNLRFVLTKPESIANGGSQNDFDVYQVGLTSGGTPDYNNLTLIKRVINGVEQAI